MGKAASSLAASVIATAMFVAPAMVRASTITQNFTLTVEPPVGICQFCANSFQLNLAKFDPLNGTLNDFTYSFSGPAFWTSSDTSPTLVTVLLLGNFTLDGHSMPVLTTPGVINLNFQGTVSNPFFLPLISGTGSAGLALGVDPCDPNAGQCTFIADSFSTPGMTGSVTYDFTPSNAVPEPGTLGLFVIGLAGLAITLRRKAIYAYRDRSDG